MAQVDLPSQEALRQLLDYNPDTGLLTWRARPVTVVQHKTWNARNAGRPALNYRHKDGYKKGTILGLTLNAHRVIWVLMTGEWPVLEIDHVNGGKTDNRWANLRVVTPSENSRNQKLPRNNTTGIVGVSRSGKGWRAVIRNGGANVTLGTFKTMGDAAVARKAAERLLGYHPNHGIFRA